MAKSSQLLVWTLCLRDVRLMGGSSALALFSHGRPFCWDNKLGLLVLRNWGEGVDGLEVGG